MAKKTKTITVRVTKRRIEDGEPGSGKFCAVAMALKPRYPSVDADTDEIELDHGDRVPTPERVARFMERYDASKRVRPFTFKLKVPA